MGDQEDQQGINTPVPAEGGAVTTTIAGEPNEELIGRLLARLVVSPDGGTMVRSIA